MSYQLDHRQLAEEMDIYFIDEQIGAGLPVWLPNGVAIRDSLEAFIKRLEHQDGYKRVSSPHLARGQLYEMSGHLKSYCDNMYPPIQWPEDGSQYYLKPMNCPHHHKVFSNQLRSYKELPYRIAEYGQVYRFENSGSLKGLSRVRGLCQNDAHIYVDPSQALQEIIRVLDLHERCYKALGLKGYRYRLSKHDPKRMQEYLGPQNLWDKCEGLLREALIFRDLPFFEAEGEAAFYAPKIDVQMKMYSGVEESMASVQLDFNSADSFQLKFVNRVGSQDRPWIIHRAPLGSHERFVALLLEYFDGQLPGWLSPIQVYIIPMHEPQQAQAQELAQQLLKDGIRVQVDLHGGSLSKRILMAHRLRPFSKIVIGPKEVSSGKVEVQMREENRIVSIDEISGFLANQLQQPW